MLTAGRKAAGRQDYRPVSGSDARESTSAAWNWSWLACSTGKGRCFGGCWSGMRQWCFCSGLACSGRCSSQHGLAGRRLTCLAVEAWPKRSSLRLGVRSFASDLLFSFACQLGSWPALRDLPHTALESSAVSSESSVELSPVPCRSMVPS